MADKPVDSAQIVLGEKRAATAGGGAAGGASTCATAKCGAAMGSLAFKLLAVAFVIGNVTALYVLHFVNRPSPTTRFSFSSFAASTGTGASVGDAVSLSSDSKLRNGAGTTAYLDRHTLSDSGVTYYEYVNMAKMGVSSSFYSTNLLSYRRVSVGASSTTKESVLTTFTVDPSSKSVTISHDIDTTNNVVANEAFRGVATMSDTRVLILSYDDTNANTYVIPGSISDGKVTLDQTNKVQVTSKSSTQYVARLSATSAIVAYYNDWATSPYYQSVKVATVADNGQVTLSAAQSFGAANDYPIQTTFAKPVKIGAGDSTAFAIPYYAASDDGTNKDKETGLCVTMSKVTSGAVEAFTTGVCNNNYRPTNYLDAIMLSENLMLIVFYDANKNNALTLATVHVSATSATFRSSYAFPEVAGVFDFGASNAFFYPEPSLALLSGNRVAVSFLNPSMSGKQSVKILKYSTESLSLKDVTPVLPLAASTFTLSIGSGSVKKAVTQQVLAVSGDGVVAMHMGMRGSTAYQHVSLVECYGAPVGVLRDLDGKTKASVAISGKADDVSTKDNMKMSKGLFYYATTAGFVMSPPTSAAGAEYFTPNEDAKMLVTADSKIGVALDGDTLFVSTSL